MSSASQQLCAHHFAVFQSSHYEGYTRIGRRIEEGKEGVEEGKGGGEEEEEEEGGGGAEEEEFQEAGGGDDDHDA